MVSTTADPQKRSGSMLQAKGIGTVILNMHVGKSIKRVRLDNVYYVPDIRKNLCRLHR